MLKKEVSKKAVNFFLAILLLAGFALQLYLMYFGYLYYQYIAPPGYDVIPHYQTIKTILSTGSVNFTAYPPLFHLIVISLGKIFNQDPFRILTYWTPALTVLPSLAMYFLLRQIFDKKISTIATLFLLLASGYPIYAFVDGNYPDILAYGVFGTLMFGFILRYFKNGQGRNLIYAALFFIATALTHHFTFLNLFFILFAFALLQCAQLLREREFKFNLRTTFLFTAVVLLILGAAYFAYQIYGELILRFVKGFFSSKPALEDGYINQVIEYPEYNRLIGNAVLYLGVIGFVYMILSNFNDFKESRAKQLVIIWVLYFYILSRFSASAIPGRFARELALPLTVGMAFLFQSIINYNGLRQSGLRNAISFGILGFLVITNSALYTGINALPKSVSEWIWFWPKDQEKLDYLASNITPDEPIVYNPKANLYIPIKALDLNLVGIELSTDEQKLVKDYINNDRSPELKKKYQELIDKLKTQYAQNKYYFIDNKPPGNPDEQIYPTYAGFEAINKVLNDLAYDGQVIKTFPDGAKLIKLNAKKIKNKRTDF